MILLGAGAQESTQWVSAERGDQPPGATRREGAACPPTSATMILGLHACSFGTECRSAQDPRADLRTCKEENCTNQIQYCFVRECAGNEVPEGYNDENTTMCIQCARRKHQHDTFLK